MTSPNGRIILMACFSVAAMLPLAGDALADGEKLMLVTDGHSPHRIVVAPDAPKAVTLAASELQHYLKESTGAELPIVDLPPAGEIRPVDALIVLGQNAYTRSLDMTLKGHKPESYALRVEGRNLIIAGDDEPGDPLAMHHPPRAGTLIGTYRFLTEHLGIHWFQPGELWEVVPRHGTLEIPPADEIREPHFVMRHLRNNYLRNNYLRFDRNTRGERIRRFMLWARRNGCGRGLRGGPSHDTRNVMRPFVRGRRYVGKDEWLALVDGRRRPPRLRGGIKPNKAWHGRKVCTTEPAIIRRHVDYARKYLNRHPEFDIAGLGLSDGYGFCECPECRALDVEGTVHITDRIFTFYQKIGQRLARSHPDRMIGTYAYSKYAEPPRRIEDLPDNIFVVHVQNGTAFRGSKGERRGMDWIRRWGEVAHRPGFFSYPRSMGFYSLPLVDTRRPARLIGALDGADYRGVYVINLNCPTAAQPAPYLYAQLLWDVQQDADALVDRFYDRLYGKVAPQVRRYHTLLEKSIRAANEGTPLEKGEFDAVSGMSRRILQYYRPVADQCRKLLDRAFANAGREEVRRRVEVLSKNFHLAEMMLRAIDLGRRIDGGESTPETDLRAQLLAVRREYHRFLRRHGNTDVAEVHAISNLRYVDDISRYLYISRALDRWYDVPVEKRPDSVYADLGFRYRPPRRVLAAERLVKLPMGWRFRTDPHGRGEENGWHAKNPDEQWDEIRVDASWTKQGYGDYHGTAWYSTTVKVPAFDTGKKVWLLFRAVDGHVRVWIDGQPAGRRHAPLKKVWDKPWAVEVTDLIQAGKEHRITVKVTKDRRAAGIWKPVELRVSQKPDDVLN